MLFSAQDLVKHSKNANDIVSHFLSNFSTDDLCNWVDSIYNHADFPTQIRDFFIQQFEHVSPDIIDNECQMYIKKIDPKVPNVYINKAAVETFKTELILTATYLVIKNCYGDAILNNPEWAWNQVGGIKARIRVMYASMHEYIALFGVNLAERGFSGLYDKMDVWDVMVCGRMLSYSNDPQGAIPRTYELGSYSYLEKGVSRYYTMDDLTYMIDYGRGFIPAAFGQGVIEPALFVDHDWKSAETEIEESAKSTFSNWGNSFKQWWHNLFKKNRREYLVIDEE